MKAKSLLGKILEIILKGLACLVGFPIAFVIEIVRMILLSITRGFPSLVDELLSVIDGWFAKPTKESLSQVDLTPIIAEKVNQIVKSVKGTYDYHFIYEGKDIEKDIDSIVYAIRQKTL